MFTKHNNFIFDWDGVFADTRLDFQPIRDKYFGGERVPLLEAALALPDPGPLMDEIRRLEIEGAERAVPVEGAVVLAARLVERARLTGRPWCIVSRNCRDAVERAAKSCGLPLPPILLTRDDGPVKPDPRALEAAAALMGVPLDDNTGVG
ncbi:MAG: HAD family hydrolase, partial [Synergistaceae bacterium]|nr:HAD family hydrolase [Synergistaceae bacterium]